MTKFVDLSLSLQIDENTNKILGETLVSKSFELRTFFGGIPLLTQPPVGVTLAEAATSNPAWMISTYLGDS